MEENVESNFDQKGKMNDMADTGKLSAGNDFWVMKFDPTSGGWSHLSPIPGHGMRADLDFSGLGFPAKFAVAGDFDGDGRQEIAVAPEAAGSGGNDFWVMKFDPASGTWNHLSPIPGHGMGADFDIGGIGFPAKFAVVGDFDGDGRQEIAVAPDAPGSAGNDFWVMKFDPASRTWSHLSPIPGHGMRADFDIGGIGFPAKFAVVGDFDGDGRQEIAVAPDAPGSAGNDFWVMKFDPASRTWSHLSPIPGHGMRADFDIGGIGFPAKFAVVGDFDGDGRQEIAVAPDASGSAGNDFWVMKFDPTSRTWSHLSPIPGHGMRADFDIGGIGFPAKFAVVGDFDGDGRQEIAVAPDAPGSAGNDFWVMKFDPTSRTWSHLSPIPGHGMRADFDIGGIGFPAKFAVVGDFDGDGRQEIAVAADAPGSAGNDFWVMKFDPTSRTWSHLSPIPGHGMRADIDFSGLGLPAMFAVVGDFDGNGREQIAAAVAVFVRREARALQSLTTFDPITLAYAKAIKVMQARPASDPTSWTYQAAIHETFAVPPAGAHWNSCQHHGWFFLPWHRMYLYFFERIVRKAVLEAGGPADFAIPYWNYDRPFPGNSLPPAFRAPTLPDGTSNPLFIAAPRRSAFLMAGGGLEAIATSAALALVNTDFSLPSFAPTFGGGRVGPGEMGGALGLLETTPHNVLHTMIGGPRSGQCAGGLMSDPRCAALDPIFWLHHASIDRLWNNWLALGGGRANPTESAWLSQKFVFFDETGTQVTLSGADVVDSATQLHYTYDEVPAAAAFAMVEGEGMEEARQVEALGPPQLAGATEAPVVLVGEPASVSLTIPVSSRALVAAAAADRTYQLFVGVEDIEAEEDPGLAYAVYLAGPGGQRRHIGNLSFFGIHAMNDPDRAHFGAPGFRHTFDATAAVDSLRREGAFDAGSITVMFEPIRVLPPPGQDTAVEFEVATPTPPVRIGRVSLFRS